MIEIDIKTLICVFCSALGVVLGVFIAFKFRIKCSDDSVFGNNNFAENVCLSVALIIFASYVIFLLFNYFIFLFYNFKQLGVVFALNF